jgi:hypothetical protein
VAISIPLTICDATIANNEFSQDNLSKGNGRTSD